MFMGEKYQERLTDHSRRVIKECLNIIEVYGDTYVAIHRDEETECVILVTVMRSVPLLSIIFADELAFKNRSDPGLLLVINDMNTSSITGWHAASLGGDSVLYMYRQCIRLTMELSYEVLFQLLKEGISEYKEGKRRIMTSSCPATPAG
jgi:hypothetical protein